MEESEAVLTTADGEKGVETASDGVGSGRSASGHEGIVAGGDGDAVAAVVEADPGPTEEEVAMAEAAAVYAALSPSDRSWVDARVTELRGLGKLGLWDLVAAPYRFFAGQPLTGCAACLQWRSGSTGEHGGLVFSVRDPRSRVELALFLTYISLFVSLLIRRHGARARRP